jgi:hypothetical protein
VTWDDWRYGSYNKTVPFSAINAGASKILEFGHPAALINAVKGIRAEVKATGTIDSNLTNNVRTAKYDVCVPPVR